jgi:2-dehydropantoate 2-reductase
MGQCDASRAERLRQAFEGALDSAPPGLIASLQRDILEGRPAELDALTAALVRLRQDVGVATPLHAFIYGSLLPLELRARGQVPFAG